MLDVRGGDRFLLASDGLTGVVSDDALARVLAVCDDPQRAAKMLKDQALANDSKGQRDLPRYSCGRRK